MRYPIIIMLTLTMALALSGCSGSPDSGAAAPPEAREAPAVREEAEAAPAAAPRDEPEGGGINRPDREPMPLGESPADGRPGTGIKPETADGTGIKPEAADGTGREFPTDAGPAARAAGKDSGAPAPVTLPDTEAARSGMVEDGSAPMGPVEPPMMPGHPGERPDRDWMPRHLPDLKAGEVDDNERWADYLRFVDRYEGPEVRRTDLRDRQMVTVLDRDGNPVPNAEVRVGGGDGKLLWTSLTYADGRTMFFPGERPGPRMVKEDRNGRDNDSLEIRVRRDGFDSEASISVQGDGETEIRMEGRMDYGGRVPLDVLFLLDSTGSMSDEIRQIKNTLQSIADQVSRLSSSPDLRFAMVSYRDRSDDYVTRLYDFDRNVERFRQGIREVRADGGGDYPESLNRALHEAVNDANWREDAIRLVFLIADAPPHLDYAQDEDYAADMVRARERGIKVFSVASSGLDEQGEYIFRQIAQQTMGRFLFILYPTGGPQGGLDTPHDVEQYSTDQLDDLIVRLIEDELEELEPGGDQDERPRMRMK